MAIDYKKLLDAIYGKRTWGNYLYEFDKETAYAQAVGRELAEKLTPANIDVRGFIKKVIFNDPATIVYWFDGTKTVVKAENEDYDPEKGLAMCICKKVLGNKGNYYEVFKKWLPEKEPEPDHPLKSILEELGKPKTFNFELKPINTNGDLFKALTGSNGNFEIGFEVKKEEETERTCKTCRYSDIDGRIGDLRCNDCTLNKSKWAPRNE